MHIARTEEHVDEDDIASEGQFWMWHAPGSGIWLNLGRTLRSPTVGFWTPGCASAVSQGYDTYVLTPSGDSFSAGGVSHGGLTEIVDCRAAKAGAPLWKKWEGPCPPPLASGLRTGLPNFDTSSEAWSYPCRCDPAYSYLNCLDTRCD